MKGNSHWLQINLIYVRVGDINNRKRRLCLGCRRLSNQRLKWLQLPKPCCRNQRSKSHQSFLLFSIIHQLLQSSLILHEMKPEIFSIRADQLTDLKRVKPACVHSWMASAQLICQSNSLGRVYVTMQTECRHNEHWHKTALMKLFFSKYQNTKKQFPQ